MRLYPKSDDVGAVHAPEGRFEPGDDGGFDLPGPLSDRLHAMAVNGERLWETSIERQRRLIQEEAARRADPATLLAAVEKLVAAAEAAPEPAPAKAPAAKAAPAKPAAARSAAGK